MVVAGTVFLLYGLALAVFFGSGHDPRDLAMLGRHFVAQGGSASGVIRLDPRYRYPAGEIGYDGQFSLFIALDPLHAPAYLDDPAGRMSRILYPLVARLLALGQPALIPWSLIVVNWLAIALGTWLAARWLAQRRVSPWWALVFGLCAGLCIGLTHDLTEPLAYALVMAGLLVLADDKGTGESAFGSGSLSRARLLAGGLLFSAAALTRETALAFPAAIALAWGIGRWQATLGPTMGARGRFHFSSLGEWGRAWQPAGLLLALAALPYLAWKIALRVWLGPGGVPANWLPAPYPFAGLIALWPWSALQELSVAFVALPALLVAPLAVSALRSRMTEGATWALVLNLLWLVVFLPRDSWDISAAPRLSDGVVLSAVLCVPLWTRLQRTWFLTPGLLWCLLSPALLLSLWQR